MISAAPATSPVRWRGRAFGLSIEAQQPSGGRIFQGSFDLGFGPAVYLLQIIEHETLSQHTCLLEEGLGFLAQVGEALTHHGSDAGRHLDLLQPERGQRIDPPRAPRRERWRDERDAGRDLELSQRRQIGHRGRGYGAGPPSNG